MRVACIDLEGVLIQEIWPFLARQTNIEKLSVTTREKADYPALMRNRITLLRLHGLKLRDVQAIVAAIEPFPDALPFLATLSNLYSIRIVSDCFYELAENVLSKLGNPISLCHRLVLDHAGFIVDCSFAARQGKDDVVAGFLASGAEVLAVGDAFNDLAMLRLANAGFLVRPSELTRAAAPDIAIVEHLYEITDAVC